MRTQQGGWAGRPVGRTAAAGRPDGPPAGPRRSVAEQAIHEDVINSLSMIPYLPMAGSLWTIDGSCAIAQAFRQQRTQDEVHRHD